MSIPPLILPEYEAVAEVIRQSEDWYEGGILRDLKRRLPKQRTVVDVGAHIGNHSVFWLQEGAETVVAFEPMPEAFRFLGMNLDAYPNAHAIRAAISCEPGFVWMAWDEVNWGRSRVVTGGDRRVPATTLDAWGIPDVSLLKVDVEGWQHHVIEGAVATLTRWTPDIIAEDDDGDLLDTLERIGMVGYRKTKTYPGANALYEWAP